VRLVTSTLPLNDEIGHDVSRFDDPLEVIQDEQEFLLAEHSRQSLYQAASLVSHAQHPGDSRGNEDRVIQRAQIDEPDALWKVLEQIGGGLQSNTGLADTTRSGDREEPHVIVIQQVHNAGDLIFSSEKRRRL